MIVTRDGYKFSSRHQAASAALDAAHDACLKANTDTLLRAPFNGVNVALDMIREVERENEGLKMLLNDAIDLLVANGIPVGVRFGKEFERPRRGTGDNA